MFAHWSQIDTGYHAGYRFCWLVCATSMLFIHVWLSMGLMFMWYKEKNLPLGYCI